MRPTKWEALVNSEAAAGRVAWVRPDEHNYAKIMSSGYQFTDESSRLAPMRPGGVAHWGAKYANCTGAVPARAEDVLVQHAYNVTCPDCLEKNASHNWTAARIAELEAFAARARSHGVRHASAGGGAVWCGARGVPAADIVGMWRDTDCRECLEEGVRRYRDSAAIKRLAELDAKVQRFVAGAAPPATGARVIPDRPHRCPRCGSAAYVGLFTLDCERGCKN